METDKDEGFREFGETIGAVFVTGVTCVLIGIVLVFLGTYGIFPSCLFYLYLVTPLLLMKWPMTLHSMVFGEPVVMSETGLMIASAIGGYIAVAVVLVIQVFLQFMIATSAL